MLENYAKNPKKKKPYEEVNFKIVTDGFVYNLDFRFGDEPMFWDQPHHKHNYDQFAWTKHDLVPGHRSEWDNFERQEPF